MKPKIIRVVNPASKDRQYNRTDYVEIELKSAAQAANTGSSELTVTLSENEKEIHSSENPLILPTGLNETNLRLIRVLGDGSEDEVPYQIDRIYGEDSEKKVLTFRSEETPPGDPDYKKATPSALFRLEEGKPKDFRIGAAPNPLAIDHYYETPEKAEPKDGYSLAWDPSRTAHTVKLRNDRLEIAIRLLPLPGLAKADDLVGSVTSVRLTDAPPNVHDPRNADNVLAPFRESPEKRWGQLQKLVFFPLPWELEWFHEFDLRGKKYDLITSNVGLMRAMVTLRSEAFSIRYHGGPLFKPTEAFRPPRPASDRNAIGPDEVEIKCHLYRVIHLNPYKKYYTEDLFVLAEHEAHSKEDIPVCFRPYYHSLLCHDAGVATWLHRIEKVPDYFALWKQVGDAHDGYRYGYGFASDAHARGLEVKGNKVWWRLPLSHHNRCIHYFMFDGYGPKPNDGHEIGNDAWFERVFKPLEAVPLAKRYPAPVPDEGGAW